MAYCHTRALGTGHGAGTDRRWLVRDDVMDLGYTINLEYLCRNQSFAPAEVVSSDLVFPRGAVPNSRILWVRVELTNGKRQFITQPLLEFYRLVELPESSIGGWTDGDRGSDHSGLNARYEINHSRGEESLSDELQLSAESASEAVATPIPDETKDRQDAGV